MEFDVPMCPEVVFFLLFNLLCWYMVVSIQILTQGVAVDIRFN
jgi:hypothetical protein